MTDRGLPSMGGAPACPFVAFEDDREARATSPDYRHRCYAEIRPAPRALAHQEAYCLSSAFHVCPTFQDWARREAAHTRAGGPAEGPATARPDDVADYDPGSLPPVDSSSQRNPPRSWSAPPPWMASRDAIDDGDEPDVEIRPPSRGAGLAGSFADRLAGGQPGRGSAPLPTPTASPGPSAAAGPPLTPEATGRSSASADDWEQDEVEADEAAAHAAALRARERTDRATARRGRAAREEHERSLAGPSWERPRRNEAYPTLKSRGLPSIGLSPVLLAVGAVVVAAVALFFLPALLGIGNPPQTGGEATPTPGASVEASGTAAAPTPTPGPTQQVYVVQPGDTMSSIANRFGVPLQTLIDANQANIPNPDLLEIGQEVIIPGAAPTTLPGVSPAP